MSFPTDVLERNAGLLNVIQPLGSVLDKMTSMGTAPLSEDVLRFKERAWREELHELRDRIYSDPRIGGRFNMNSHAQCVDVLYGKLKLRNGNGILQKQSANQYAINFFYYTTKDPLLRTWGRYNRLKHRKLNFVDKLLSFDTCRVCGGKDYWKCDSCRGSGLGEVLGPNPRYVSVRDGWWWLHPVYLQLAVTGRINCLDPNLLQWPRNSVTWGIDCRDIFVAPPGKSFVLTDRSKAERLVGAVIFSDPVMLSEVRSGSGAFSLMARDCFKLPEEECRKGTDWYTAMKTSAYADQYFVQETTLHEYLLKQDIYLPVDECRRVLDFLARRYSAYKNSVENFVWDKINMDTPFVRNLHGRILRLERPFEISGLTLARLKNGRNGRARQAFYELCRTISSFIIQGSATGDDCQLTALKIVDHLDQITRPGYFNPVRYFNGDWNRACPFIFKHDEWGVLCDDDLVPEVVRILEMYARDFGNLEPYLKNGFRADFNMGCETEVEKQWGVNPPQDISELTETKSPSHFYRDGVRFKV